MLLWLFFFESLWEYILKYLWMKRYDIWLCPKIIQWDGEVGRVLTKQDWTWIDHCWHGLLNTWGFIFFYLCVCSNFSFKKSLKIMKEYYLYTPYDRKTFTDTALSHDWQLSCTIAKSPPFADACSSVIWY